MAELWFRSFGTKPLEKWLLPKPLARLLQLPRLPVVREVTVAGGEVAADVQTVGEALDQMVDRQ